MSILLLGRWDESGNLTIEESHVVASDDQDTINELVNAQDNEDNMAWATSFEVDTHKEAVVEAYETYVRDSGSLLDEAAGFVI